MLHNKPPPKFNGLKVTNIHVAHRSVGGAELNRGAVLSQLDVSRVHLQVAGWLAGLGGPQLGALSLRLDSVTWRPGRVLREQAEAWQAS